MTDESTNAIPQVPAADEPSSTAEKRAANCPYCLSGIAAGEDVEVCPECRATYHRDCWAENGGCAVYGCAKVPVVESRRAIEVPVSYWGQENKPCPACGQQILAAALRCRHCGATFASARPQDTAEFQTRTALEAELPSARKQVVITFVLSVIPFSAPVAAVWGTIWRWRNREALAALPALYAGLSKIGWITALAVTAAMIVMTTLYVGLRG